MRISFIPKNEREPILRSLEPRTVFSGRVFGGERYPRTYVRTNNGVLCLDDFHHAELDELVTVQDLKILGNLEFYQL